MTEFEPERVLNLGGRIRFVLAPLGDGCRLTLDLTRPPDGWSPMALAGFHGWVGRLTRLLAGAPQDETEAWALGVWNAVIGHCEWEVRRYVSGGAPPIWRIHFDENDAGLTGEAAAQLDELAQLLRRENLAVTIDGFGDDPAARTRANGSARRGSPRPSRISKRPACRGRGSTSASCSATTTTWSSAIAPPAAPTTAASSCGPSTEPAASSRCRGRGAGARPRADASRRRRFPRRRRGAGCQRGRRPTGCGPRL